MKEGGEPGSETEKKVRRGSGRGDGGSRFLASLVAAAIAETTTLPVDTTRVRLQVQKKGSGGRPPVYTSMLQCAGHISRHEGARALFKGLQPALLRQCSYTSIAIVLYEPIRNSMSNFTNEDEPSIGTRLLCGGTAGSIGIAICNPTEVIKTQMQAATGKQRAVKSVFLDVWRKSGVKGMWAGVTPNMARCFIGNAAELGVYDHAKHFYSSRYDLPESAVHVAASTTAGVVSAILSNPIDVVKTRLQHQAGHSSEYKGPLHCATTMARHEGPLSLYKGFIPVLLRKVSWATIFFVSYERLRAILNNGL